MDDNRDVHYLKNELNLTHVESWGQGKTHPDFSKLAQMFGAKPVPPRTPHGMNECLGPTLVQSPWAGFDETEQFYWATYLEFGLALNPAPSIKLPNASPNFNFKNL
jgi:hypothetical protein